MHSNIALMRQKLERLKSKREAIQAEAKGLAKGIIPLINPSLHEIKDMDIEKAAANMDDLVVRKGELLSLQAQIWDLEEELGS